MCLTTILFSDILASANFWTAISGFGGAIVGGVVSYIFQKGIESQKLRQDRTANYQRYFLFIDSVFSISKMIYEENLKEYQDNPARHLSIPYIHTYIPESDPGDPAMDLFYLAQMGDISIIGDLMTLKSRYITFFRAFEERNRLIIEELQPKLPPTGLHGDFNLQQLNEMFGAHLNSRLKSNTESIYMDLEWILENGERIKTEAGRVFKKVFPEKKLLRTHLKNSSWLRS